MINNQLLDYIRQSINNGFPKDQITAELLKNNWTLGDINEAFYIINTNELSKPKSEQLVSANNIEVNIENHDTGSSKNYYKIKALGVLFLIISIFGYYEFYKYLNSFMDSELLVKTFTQSFVWLAAAVVCTFKYFSSRMNFKNVLMLLLSLLFLTEGVNMYYDSSLAFNYYPFTFIKSPYNLIDYALVMITFSMITFSSLWKPESSIFQKLVKRIVILIALVIILETTKYFSIGSVRIYFLNMFGYQLSIQNFITHHFNHIFSYVRILLLSLSIVVCYRHVLSYKYRPKI